MLNKLTSSINFSDYKSILCLDGELPEKNFFSQSQLPVFAADGAANKLNKLNIIPDLVIGDLDSVLPELINNFSTLHLPDQDTNDFQKAMIHLKQNNLLPTIIVGASGGCLDHVLNNINIFLNTKSVLYAPPLRVYVFDEPGELILELPINTKVSIIGIPSVLLSTEGLKWDLDKINLSFPGETSCFNRIVSTNTKITLHKGKALFLIYDDPSFK